MENNPLTPTPPTNTQLPVEVEAIASNARNKMPVIFDFKNGNSILLSLREKLICDSWLRTHSYKMVCEEYNKVIGKPTSYGVVKKYLEKPHVQVYLKNRLNDMGFLNGWTKEKWIKECTLCGQDKSRGHAGTMFYLKLIGQALGYLGGMTLNADNMQINILQGNGER